MGSMARAKRVVSIGSLFVLPGHCHTMMQTKTNRSMQTISEFAD
jgi:hypothetical protein